MGAWLRESDLASGNSETDDGTQTAVVNRGAEDLALGDVAELENSERYVVLEQIGSGGMGTVVRAYDVRLRREVALKRLKAHCFDADAESRLIREAQAMAQLSHANVVSVYDVTVRGGDSSDIVIAMEYVAGETLREWLRDAPRSWTQIVGTFLQAGSGLAAAHRVGIIHRDFKPANVLVAPPEGRGYTNVVKVTDFGLAKPIGASDSLEPSIETPAAAELPRESSAPLTRADVIIGTPRYMAPEQHDGTSAGPRADQYAFCVALWEALNEEPPFPGRGETLLANKRKGPPGWPRNSRVPNAVARAIVRGLSVAPGDRWRSMQDLLAALDLGGVRRRRRLAWGAAGVLAVGTLAGAAASGSDEVCQGARAHLENTWGEVRRDEVQHAIDQTGLVFAPDSWRYASTELDRYTEAWIAAHRDACEATSVHGEQSQTTLDLRMRCLREAKTELDAAVDLLARGDHDAVKRVVSVVGDLPPLDRCGDADRLSSQQGLPSDPAVAASVSAARIRLSEGRTLISAGKYDESLALARKLQSSATDLDYPPLRAEVGLLLGESLDRSGASAEAEGILEETVDVALSSGSTEIGARASSLLGLVVGRRLGRGPEGRAWARNGLSLARSVGDARVEAASTSNLAGVVFGLGDYDRAEKLERRALEIRRTALGPEHPDVASSLSNLGNILEDQGDFAGSEEVLREALAIRRRILGDVHPQIAQTLDNLAETLGRLGRFKEAESVAREALAISERAMGPDHPDTMSALGSVAMAMQAMGNFEEAVRLHERVLELREKHYGKTHPSVANALNNLAAAFEGQAMPDQAVPHLERSLDIRLALYGEKHPGVAQSLNNLAAAKLLSDDHDGAGELLRRALSIRERLLGPNHPEIARAMSNLALVIADEGDIVEAESLLRRALVVHEELVGEDHPDVGRVLNNLAAVAYRDGRPHDALPLAARATTIRSANDIPVQFRVRTQFLYAEILWDVGKERPKARQLAQEARDLLAQSDAADTRRPMLEEIESWLRAHHGPTTPATAR